MECNTREKAIKTETRHKNRIKGSEQAQLVYVKGINYNIPTTCRWAHEEEITAVTKKQQQHYNVSPRRAVSTIEGFERKDWKTLLPLPPHPPEKKDVIIA